MGRITICQDNQDVADFCNFAERVIGISEKGNEVRRTVKESFEDLADLSDIFYNNNIYHINLDKFDISDLENVIEDVTDRYGTERNYSISSRETMLGTTILSVEW